MSKFLPTRDLLALAGLGLAALAMWQYRAAYIEPRAWGTICAAAAPPLACLPRAGLIWLQREYVWGSAALALGLFAFLARGPWAIAILAVIFGIFGVQNYNATWGMLGAALGVWTWIGQEKGRKNVLF